MTTDELQTHLSEIDRLQRALPGQLRVTTGALRQGRFPAAAGYADVAAALSASLTATLRTLRDGLRGEENQPGLET
jgi:uncharacterized protein involved in propanediol utilization